jgi:hypothetical protein
LLHGFEGAREWCGAQVDHVAVADERGHEVQLVDVEVSKTLA